MQCSARCALNSKKSNKKPAMYTSMYTLLIRLVRVSQDLYTILGKTSFTLNCQPSNSDECMGVKGEALQLHAVYKKPYLLLQVTQNPYCTTE